MINDIKDEDSEFQQSKILEFFNSRKLDIDYTDIMRYCREKTSEGISFIVLRKYNECQSFLKKIEKTKKNQITSKHYVISNKLVINFDFQNSLCINFTLFDLRNFSFYNLKSLNKSKFAYKVYDLFKNEGIKVYKMTDFSFLRNISNDVELNYCLVSLFKEFNIHYSFDLVNPRLDIYNLKIESEYDFKISQSFDKSMEKYVNSVELVNSASEQGIFLSLSSVDEEMILIKKNQKEMNTLLGLISVKDSNKVKKKEEEQKDENEQKEEKSEKKPFNLNFTSEKEISFDNLSLKDIKKLKRMKKMIDGNNDLEISEYSNVLNEELLSLAQQNNDSLKKIEFISQKMNAINIRLKKPPMTLSQIELEEDTDSEEEIFSVGEYTLKDTLNDNKRINFAMQKLKDLNIIDEDNDIVKTYFEDFNKIDRQELENLFKENIKVKKNKE